MVNRSSKFYPGYTGNKLYPARNPISYPIASTTSDYINDACASTHTRRACLAEGNGSSQKGGGLVVYSFFMYGDTGIKMKRAFKERTGLDVEFITGTGAPQIERIKAEYTPIQARHAE